MIRVWVKTGYAPLKKCEKSCSKWPDHEPLCIHVGSFFVQAMQETKLLQQTSCRCQIHHDLMSKSVNSQERSWHLQRGGGICHHRIRPQEFVQSATEAAAPLDLVFGLMASHQEFDPNGPISTFWHQVYRIHDTSWYICLVLSRFFWFIVAFFHIQNNIQVTPLEAGWVDLTFDASTTCQWLWFIITDGSKVEQTLVKSFRNHRSVTKRVSLERCAVQIPLS